MGDHEYQFTREVSVYPPNPSTEISSPPSYFNPPPSRYVETAPTPSKFPYIEEEALVRVQIRTERKVKTLYQAFCRERQETETRNMTRNLTQRISAAIQPPQSMDYGAQGPPDLQGFDQMLRDLQMTNHPPVPNTQPLQASLLSLQSAIFNSQF
jgi:hypothetical protein